MTKSGCGFPFTVTMEAPLELLRKMLRGTYIEGLPTFPPSAYSWLFPAKMDFGAIDRGAITGDFPSIQGLAPSLFFALLFGAIRLLLHHTAFEVS